MKAVRCEHRNPYAWRVKRILLLLPCLFWASAADLGPFQAELKALLPPNPKAGVAIGHFTADSETVTETVTFVGNPAFDRETLFEYGSITKVFTSVVLAELAQEGVVDLEHSVNRLLPKDVRDEKWRDVTLFNLATHSAGLPTVPDNSYIHALLNPRDPYDRFDDTFLYKAAELVRLEPVGEHNYSNFSFGLLGELVGRASSTPYKTLVETRIFQPLIMTSATMTGWHSNRAALPLSRTGGHESYWNFDALAGAAAARGSVTDALKFLRASAKACRSAGQLAAANCRTQQATEVRTYEGAVQGLGWIRFESTAGDIVWHNGGTGGYSSFVGFNARTGEGLVVLANVSDFDEVTSSSLDFLTAPK